MRRMYYQLKYNVKLRLTVNVFWKMLIGLVLVQIYTPKLAYYGLRYTPTAIGISYMAYMLFCYIKNLHILSH